MSHWTYVTGMVEVDISEEINAGTQLAFQTKLNHLPPISGSEENAYFHIIKRGGVDCRYFIVVEGNLRDRQLNETYRETVKWLFRLAKRCQVIGVFLCVKGCGGRSAVIDIASGLEDMYGVS